MAQRFCTACGAAVENVAQKFCVQCGAALPAETVEPVIIPYNPGGERPKPLELPHHPQKESLLPPIVAYSDEPYEADDENVEDAEQRAFADKVKRFVVSSAIHYVPAFLRVRDGNDFGWNSSAFFFTITWLFYRKMYAYGFAALFVEFMISFIGGWGSIVLILLYRFALGIFADAAYYHRFEETMKYAAASDAEDGMALIAKRKGTSVAAAVLIYIGLAFLELMINAMG